VDADAHGRPLSIGPATWRPDQVTSSQVGAGRSNAIVAAGYS
jgi:hypothetical protein